MDQDQVVDYLNPSFDDINRAAKKFAAYIKLNKIQSVIAVARGGVILGELTARYAEVPCHHIYYSSKQGQGDGKNHNNEWMAYEAHFPALIVDDICDSGLTLKEIVDKYNDANIPVYTATFFFKAHETPAIMPNIWDRSLRPDAGWVNFPWEK